jgi:hypothetical protein
MPSYIHLWLTCRWPWEMFIFVRPSVRVSSSCQYPPISPYIHQYPLIPTRVGSNVLHIFVRLRFPRVLILGVTYVMGGRVGVGETHWGARLVVLDPSPYPLPRILDSPTDENLNYSELPGSLQKVAKTIVFYHTCCMSEGFQIWP